MDSLFFHPKVVHLPIALGLLLPPLSLGLLLAWWRSWLPSRAFLIAVALQAALVASGIASLRSGEAEEDRVERFVPESALESHEEAAQAFVGAATGVLVVMAVAAALGKRRSGLFVAGAATLGTLAVLGLGYRTGEAGGRLVYQHQAAQAYASPAGEGAPQPPPPHREHDDD